MYAFRPSGVSMAMYHVEANGRKASKISAAWIMLSQFAAIIGLPYMGSLNFSLIFIMAFSAFYGIEKFVILHFCAARCAGFFGCLRLEFSRCHYRISSIK